MNYELRKLLIPPLPPLVSDPERSLTRREKGGWGDLKVISRVKR